MCPEEPGLSVSCHWTLLRHLSIVRSQKGAITFRDTCCRTAQICLHFLSGDKWGDKRTLEIFGTCLFDVFPYLYGEKIVGARCFSLWNMIIVRAIFYRVKVWLIGSLLFVNLISYRNIYFIVLWSKYKNNSIFLTYRNLIFAVKIEKNPWK